MIGDVMMNPDIDGGWAWLVLAASFLIHIMTYGMSWSTGVYNVIFLNEFQQSKSVTAWAGAMPTAMMYASGNDYFFTPKMSYSNCTKLTDF